MINDYQSGNIVEKIIPDVIYEDELDEISNDESSESIELEDSTDEILKTQQDTEGTQQQLTESES